MEFKQLQSFVSVVQEGSFTQAAAKLFISQPTISLHISQLEAELNTRLILRTTKSIRVTAKGHELYGYAINILELKKRMLQACSIENQRIIHLGASTIPSAYILPHLLPQFGSLHSDIYFVIHQSDSQGIIDGLHSGLFNLGFIGMPTNDDDLICQPFCQDRMIIITPVNEHFLSLKSSNASAISLLEQEPLILRENGSGSQKIADKFLAGSGLDTSKLHIVAASTTRRQSKTWSQVDWVFLLFRHWQLQTLLRKSVCWPLRCHKSCPSAACIWFTARTTFFPRMCRIFSNSL